jgi:hypothetical protein
MRMNSRGNSTKRHPLRLLSICALLAPFYSATLLATPPAPELTFDQVNIRADGDVSFSTLAIGSETRTDFPVALFLPGQTEDNSYRLYVEVESIQQLRFNAFTFTAYLVDAGSASSSAYKFQVTGNPKGSFRDMAVWVSFRVKTPAGSKTGRIQIPVYNAAKIDLLSVAERKELEYVSISGPTAIRTHLANIPESLPITVTEISATDACPKCWARISSDVTENNPLTVEPGGSADFSLNVVPKSMPALMQGALIIKPDVPHDTLLLSVTYHTVPGGSARKQTISVPIRFGPGLFGLALALCGGLALGLTARYLLTGKLGKDTEPALHAILFALVFGLIAESIGFMMTAYGNSKLVLFDLDIDPRQLFPAFILATLVSGGSAVITWMKGLFGKT